MNGTTQGISCREGGTFLGLCKLWGRELVDWNCCWRLEPRFWATKCGEWIAKRARSPCGLIPTSWGWPSIDIWNNIYDWEEHSLCVCVCKSFVMFIMLFHYVNGFKLMLCICFFPWIVSFIGLYCVVVVWVSCHVVCIQIFKWFQIMLIHFCSNDTWLGGWVRYILTPNSYLHNNNHPS